MASPHGHSCGSCGTVNLDTVFKTIQSLNFWPYNLYETAQKYIISVPMPGFQKEDLEIAVKDQTLLVSTLSSAPSPVPKNAKVLVSYGKILWERPVKLQIQLAKKINSDLARAKLTSGVLTIKLEKI